MKKVNLNQIMVFVTLFVLAVLSRWVSHAWNFTLIGGVALFAGAYFANRSTSLVLVLLSLFVSDLLIGFHNQMPVVYLSYLAMAALGFLINTNASRLKVAGLAISGSLIFFVVSNFAVWSEGVLYSQDFSGLMQSYLMAIPFFKNQFLSDVVSAFAFFEIAKSVNLVSEKFAQQKNQIVAYQDIK